MRKIIASLCPLMADRDLAGFRDACATIERESRVLPVTELTAAVAQLAEILSGWPRGVFAELATVTAGLVTRGASSRPLAGTVPACALAAMRQRLDFDRYWPLPDGPLAPDADMSALVSRFRAFLPARSATGIALSWFDTGHWTTLAATLAERRSFRAATELLPEIAGLAFELADRVPQAARLARAASVLDDYPLIVIDAASGRAFRLTASGIGDNYQLHTLVAARLIAVLVPGEPLPEGWVARASTDPPYGTPIALRFRLFDVAGQCVPVTGIPADIPATDGRLVLELRPPDSLVRWDRGRLHPDMRSSLTLDRELTPAELSF